MTKQDLTVDLNSIRLIPAVRKYNGKMEMLMDVQLRLEGYGHINLFRELENYFGHISQPVFEKGFDFPPGFARNAYDLKTMCLGGNGTLMCDRQRLVELALVKAQLTNKNDNCAGQELAVTMRWNKTAVFRTHDVYIDKITEDRITEGLELSLLGYGDHRPASMHVSVVTGDMWIDVNPINQPAMMVTDLQFSLRDMRHPASGE
jgi:hypothetical protein